MQLDELICWYGRTVSTVSTVVQPMICDKNFTAIYLGTLPVSTAADKSYLYPIGNPALEFALDSALESDDDIFLLSSLVKDDQSVHP